MYQKEKKFSSILFILIGITGLFFLFYHAIKFEKVVMLDIDLYYPANTSNNIGGWNSFAYFTYLSNILVDLYLICLGLAKLNVKKVQKVVYNPYIQGTVTVNIVITGLIYAVLLSPSVLLYPWNGPMAFSNIINFWNHIIIPVFMLVLWFFPFTNKLLEKKFVWFSLIFPAAYFIFSIVRGELMSPNWYPYPFLNPQQLWYRLIKDIPFEQVKGFIVFIAFIMMISGLFILVAISLKFIRNKIINKKIYKTYELSLSHK